MRLLVRGDPSILMNTMDNLDSLSQVCPKACLSDDSVKLTVNVNYHRQGNTTLQIVSGVVYEAL